MTTHFTHFTCVETAVFIGSQDALSDSGLERNLRIPLYRLEYRDLGPDRVSLNVPGVIYSPLFCAEFDAIDIGMKLHDLGYTGLYRPVCPSLPNPKMVADEIRRTCPATEVRLWEVKPEIPVRLVAV
ncbi:hypothetical protein SAMN05421688_0778 [Poseidonocella pacifica]|uniref:Uncharacterized protein n=1 Tax=Poseidonocella pacifica TaxID=871651 RepID=A0A1I0VLZ9_9RHOB|nr:hypothetical protein [Poseidonocella pacifica]SFA77444.1 hypothetical protein SAMN05421688_0778 [Poseidonocella pacifica]